MKIVAVFLIFSCILVTLTGATSLSTDGMMCVTGICSIVQGMEYIIECNPPDPSDKVGTYCVQPKSGEICSFVDDKLACVCDPGRCGGR